ncbi:unnamed protein product [Rhizoctonia solani]|uniref:BTB domain-containing protein n=1 Tax=Rhizoctonia solani TaxID=456999 RepID=A0A8H3DNF3_9AGAM|nr:unnamed protein product [Rhizoctonia solani]
MSELENSGNNPLPLPPTLPVAARSDMQSYVRDSKYYYRDGSAVFLAEGQLFKFHVSLIAADPEVEDYEFKHLIKDALDGFEGDMDKPGSNDSNPIVLPTDVRAAQFRKFLMIVYGGVADNEFQAFLHVLQTPSDYSGIWASRLIRLGYLACRFGMKRLDAWVQVQIHTMLRHFVRKHRVIDDWNARDILRLVRYMQTTTVIDYQHELLDFMRNIISTLIVQNYAFNDATPHNPIINVCAALYQEREVLIDSPGFFGFIFAIIVSLGHRSPIWIDRLTREDRRILYAANTILICLSDHANLDVSWVIDPSVIKNVCTECSSMYDGCWKESFSRCKGLKSRVLLEDIRHIAALPDYRFPFVSLLSRRITSCQCLNNMSTQVEQRMESLYCALTEKYKHLVE